MPLVFASWVVGMLSEYEQDLALYGTFSVLNGIVGAVIFFFHSTGNQQVRAYHGRPQTELWKPLLQRQEIDWNFFL